jgi:hypothetical protein
MYGRAHGLIRGFLLLAAAAAGTAQADGRWLEIETYVPHDWVPSPDGLLLCAGEEPAAWPAVEIPDAPGSLFFAGTLAASAFTDTGVRLTRFSGRFYQAGPTPLVGDVLLAGDPPFAEVKVSVAAEAGFNAPVRIDVKLNDFNEWISYDAETDRFSYQGNPLEIPPGRYDFLFGGSLDYADPTHFRMTSVTGVRAHVTIHDAPPLSFTDTPFRDGFDPAPAGLACETR